MEDAHGADQSTYCRSGRSYGFEVLDRFFRPLLQPRTTDHTGEPPVNGRFLFRGGLMKIRNMATVLSGFSWRHKASTDVEGGSERLRSLHAYFCLAQADSPSVFSTVPVTIATPLP